MKKNNKIKIENLDIFLSFLLLGFTSFGGPIAHIGYFRNFFVKQKKWLDEKLYADFVSICNFLKKFKLNLYSFVNAHDGSLGKIDFDFKNFKVWTFDAVFLKNEK